MTSAKDFWAEQFKDEAKVKKSDFRTKITDFLNQQEKKEEYKYDNEYPDNFISDVLNRFFLITHDDDDVSLESVEIVLNAFGGNMNTVFQVINDNVFISHSKLKTRLFEIFHGHDKKEIIYEALGTQKDGGGWYCLRFPDTPGQGGLLLTYNKQSSSKRKVSFENVPLKYVKMKNNKGMKWRAIVSVPAKNKCVTKKLFFENLGDFIVKMTQLGKISKPREHQLSYEVLGDSISDAEIEDKVDLGEIKED